MGIDAGSGHSYHYRMRPVQRSITTVFIVLVILVGTIALTSVYLNYYLNQKQKPSKINSFEECAKSYPVIDEGQSFFCKTPNHGFSKPDSRDFPAPTEASVSASFQNPGWITFLWDTSYGGNKKFSIDYPGEWYRDGRVLYPEGKDSKFIIVLGAAGKGLSDKVIAETTTRKFNGIKMNYFWIKSVDFSSGGAYFNDNNISYIFDAINIPLEKNAYYEQLFIKMLNTFKKV